MRCVPFCERKRSIQIPDKDITEGMKTTTHENTRLTMNTSVSRTTGEIKEHEYSRLVRAGGTRR